MGSRLGQSNENSDHGRLESDCDLDELHVEDQQSKVQDDGAKDAEHAGTRLTSVRCEITWTCFSTFTEIGTVAREKGATWNSYIAEAETRIEAVRSFFDGGVSTVCDDKIKNRVASAYVI